MGGRSGLGEFEHLVLLVVLRLGGQAFAPDIAGDLASSADRAVSRGALYSTLNRLEEKGLLSWAPEEPGADRGGHIRRLFTVTELGLAELRRRKATLQTLWDGVGVHLDGSPS